MSTANLQHAAVHTSALDPAGAALRWPGWREMGGSAEQAQPAGDLLRRARRLADLSQRELATKAGVSPRVVERIESGETAAPRLSTVLALLTAAGCHLELRRGAPDDNREEVVTDRAGRRFPAHLDVRDVDAFGTWWGDWPLLSTRVEKIWHRAPRQRPQHTFDLARWRRDARRRLPPPDGEATPGG